MNLSLGRPLAAALLLGGVLLVGCLAVAASWADLSAAVAEQDANAAFVAGNVVAHRRAVVSPDGNAPARLFVEADSETLAASSIDALLRSTTADAGGSISSSRAEVKHDAEAIGSRIEIQAVVEGSNDAIQTILFRLETGSPTLLLDTLELQPADGTGGSSEAVPPDQLRARLTLSAYWKRSSG